jgi:transposase
MPPRTLPFIENQIVALLEQGTPAKRIPQLVEPPVSYTKVLKVKRNLWHWGTARAPQIIKPGRTPKITVPIGEALDELLLNKPSHYVDEMMFFIWDEFEVWVTESTVRRWLRKKKYTKKIIARRALERSRELRDHWRVRTSRWNPDQIVCVDESAANERTCDRKYGWAPIGIAPVEYIPVKRSKRWSILPAYTMDGFIAHEIFQGSYTAVRFNNFVREQLLPRMSPFVPGGHELSVIVLDNARIHRNQELREMCEAVGVKLEFLPPYSPDFNPIEASFHGKKYIAR